MAKHIVCQVSDLEIGKIVPAEIGRAPIILSKLPSGEIRAVAGRCPHQGAELKHGCITGRTESGLVNHLEFGGFGETLRCPWHGFEFSLVDGKPVVAGTTHQPMKLRFFDVQIEGTNVVVTV
jgi:nitrite reductase/ring-hydroxylating ferredoxin subunit